MDDLDLLIIGPNRYVGGIQQYINEQSKHLKNDFGITIYDVEAPEVDGLLRWPLALLATGFDMLRFPLRRRPSLVHIHTAHARSFYRSTFYVLFAAYVWRIPVVLHVHGSSFDDFVSTNSSLSHFVQNLVYEATDKVIVLSEYWRDLLSQYVDEEKIVVVPNAVDPDNYSPVYDIDPPTIVFISHLIDRKGVTEFVEVVDDLLTRDQIRANVEIAGTGPLSESVKQLAKEHSTVEYHGYVSEEKKRTLLNQGSIYVLPSHAEGLPIAILEAMAGGTAILSTTVGSIPEVIDEANGRLVTPGDSDALLAELERLVKSPEEVRSMGQRNRECIEEQYSWSKVIDKLDDVYKSCPINHG